LQKCRLETGVFNLFCPAYHQKYFFSLTHMYLVHKVQWINQRLIYKEKSSQKCFFHVSKIYTDKHCKNVNFKERVHNLLWHFWSLLKWVKLLETAIAVEKYRLKATIKPPNQVELLQIAEIGHSNTTWHFKWGGGVDDMSHKFFCFLKHCL